MAFPSVLCGLHPYSTGPGRISGRHCRPLELTPLRVPADVAVRTLSMTSYLIDDWTDTRSLEAMCSIDIAFFAERIVLNRHLVEEIGNH
jgi:hypothetical protein